MLTRAPHHVDFRQFAAMSLDLLCTANVEGYFLWVSPRWTDVLGWSSEELCSRPFVEFVHPDDAGATNAELAQIATERPTYHFTNRYRCKGGGWRWLEWVSQRGTDGIVYAIARDVTESRRPSAEATRRLHLLEMSEEAAHIGHWYVDFGANQSHWSPEVYRLHGYDPASFQPDPENTLELVHVDDREALRLAIEAAVVSGAPFDIEFRVLRPSGEVRLVHSMGRAELHPTTGEVVGLIGVSRDITDDPRVRRQNDLEQFAYIASHDLKEPVRTIQSHLRLLRDEPAEALDPRRAQIWRFVDSAAQRMNELLDALLQYARSGEALSLQAVDLAELLPLVVADLAARIDELDACVEIEALPRVVGHPARLRQVFQNLIGNALTYRGSERPIVRVYSRREGGRHVVHVYDNGMGFDPRAAERIFLPFRRLHTHDEIPGTGIGLAVVKRIVEQCEGRVWAESEPGCGSTFYVELHEAPADE